MCSSDAHTCSFAAVGLLSTVGKIPLPLEKGAQPLGRGKSHTNTAYLLQVIFIIAFKWYVLVSQSVREVRSHGEISRVAAGWIEQKGAAERGIGGLRKPSEISQAWCS